MSELGSQTCQQGAYPVNLPTDMSIMSGLVEELGMEFLLSTPERVEMRMPITPRVLQLYGFVHGGATIALLETAASWGAALRSDFAVERPFGIEANIRHWKSGREGSILGVAEFDREEKNKQFWKVTAYDDSGDVMSSGTFVTKIVSLERLAEIERQRAERS